MGKVKMPLGRALLVHGTSQPASIGTAASHACIRMHNTDAVALAQLVQEYGGTAVPEAATDSLLRRWHPNRRIALLSPVPVRIVYHLVELHADTLVVHPDVYRRGGDTIETDALALLATAGYDTATVDRELIRNVAEKGTRSRAMAAIPRR
jgi:murein L,D-transpeptidase YcbB/YkuD